MWRSYTATILIVDRLHRVVKAGVAGATRSAGKETFGADMAMVWYGGSQHDGLWESRYRTSLYHAWLRGADPVYAEHGIMDYHALGKRYGKNHPDVVSQIRVPSFFFSMAYMRSESNCPHPSLKMV